MHEDGKIKTQTSRISQDDDSLKDLNTDPTVTPGVYYPRNKVLHSPRFKLHRKTIRAVSKNGEFNIEKPQKSTFHISKWFVTMVEARWRWTLLNFFTAYTIDWLFFGLVYYIIALVHGDLVEKNLPPNQNMSNWIPCVENIYGFTSTFLFSVEVHTTVAYGKRSITLECPQAIGAMCLQCVLSSIFQAFMVGILFAKFTRPKARTQTILFSKHAVVNLKNERLCLVFRVGDIRKSRILNVRASVFVIRINDTEDCSDDCDLIEVKTELDGCESSFFLWPLTVIHVIDEKSPLYKVSAADLLCRKFEIIAVFEGTIETTGQPIQTRTSYTGGDILWGHRLIPMVEFNQRTNIFHVDFSKLSETEQFETPLCSAFEYENILSVISSNIDDSHDELDT